MDAFRRFLSLLPESSKYQLQPLNQVASLSYSWYKQVTYYIISDYTTIYRTLIIIAVKVESVTLYLVCSINHMKNRQKKTWIAPRLSSLYGIIFCEYLCPQGGGSGEEIENHFF